jgi:hypothetical protein
MGGLIAPASSRLRRDPDLFRRRRFDEGSLDQSLLIESSDGVAFTGVAPSALVEQKSLDEPRSVP